jgi:peptidoglycan/LPS O-acetylase OafA/YrhL
VITLSPVSALPAVACVLVAVATAFALMRVAGEPSAEGRFGTIDGLRGYLAFFVFLHHAGVWYFFLQTGKWAIPPSNLFTHFGQASVAFFFMITGFLFFTKLINGKVRPIDWLHLFVSRFMRLVPLYLLAMALMFSIVLVLSHASLVEPASVILKNASRWLLFTAPGAYDLNGVIGTRRIVAGVTWSLPYEWFFYFSLPLLALTVRVLPSLPALAIGIAGSIWLYRWLPDVSLIEPFAGGIAAAVLARNRSIIRFACTRVASVAVLVLISSAVAFFESAYSLAPLVLLSIAFVLISGGCSLFQTLTKPVSRFLGEQAYSLYLLHGILLFITFNFVIGLDSARSMSPVAYWGVILGLTPFLVGICYCTFRFVEAPGMRMTTLATRQIRSMTGQAAAPVPVVVVSSLETSP